MNHWIKIVFFCGALLLIPVLTLLKEPAAASYYENRSLAVFPPFSMQEVLDGEYFPKVETWVGDHLAGRNLLLKLNTQKELALHSPVVNDGTSCCPITARCSTTIMRKTWRKSWICCRS